MLYCKEYTYWISFLKMQLTYPDIKLNNGFDISISFKNPSAKQRTEQNCCTVHVLIDLRKCNL